MEDAYGLKSIAPTAWICICSVGPAFGRGSTSGGEGEGALRLGRGSGSFEGGAKSGVLHLVSGGDPATVLGSLHLKLCICGGSAPGIWWGPCNCVGVTASVGSAPGEALCLWGLCTWYLVGTQHLWWGPCNCVGVAAPGEALCLWGLCTSYLVGTQHLWWGPYNCVGVAAS
eukprot:1145153-Pelagomonas_calceolata.AAC.3